MQEESARIVERKYLIVFGVLLLVAVGLGVTNLVLGLNRNSEESATVIDGDDPEQVIGEGEPTNEEDEVVKTPSEVISEYQALIDSSTDVWEKARLHEERIDAIFATGGTCEDYGEQMIDDALAADAILQSPDSAVMVVNMTQDCGRSDLAEKYRTIIAEREKALGIDPNMETRG